MRFPDIRVYLVGKTVPIVKNMQEWIRSLPGGEDYELPSDATDAELVIGSAAKRCYMSFKPGMNPNVTKVRESLFEYFDNILSSGHGCYDGETDVLTADGWKNWSVVSRGDLFATRRSDGVIEYHPAKTLFRAPYSGRMFRIESSGVDLLVTPNHRLLVADTRTRRGRCKCDAAYTLVAAEDVGLSSHAHVKDGVWPDPSGPQLPPDVMQLLGFSIGDGHFNGYTVEFHLRRVRKIEFLRDLAGRLGWVLKENVCNDDYRVAVPDEWKHLFAGMYDDLRRKIIPQYLLVSQGSRGLQALLTGLLQSDGHNGKTSLSFDSTSPVLINQLQHLCLHVGLAANVGYCTSSSYRKNNGSYGDKPLTRVYVIRRNLRPEINKWDGQTGRSSWVENWSGEVFCAEVPNNTLYVRRNGKPVWCGNSVLEHAVFNVAIEGVTRVFTGEMNRHRAGVAISEGSMRYIRFRDIPFWIPPSLTVCPEDSDELRAKKTKTLESIRRVLEVVETEYALQEDLWGINDQGPNALPFATKKVITSMLRRIVPMGTCTGGMWTLNIRAMRHVVATRSSPSAEEEIAYVFGMIGKIMHDSEPRLFGDFEQRDGFWVPKYHKV